MHVRVIRKLLDRAVLLTVGTVARARAAFLWLQRRHKHVQIPSASNAGEAPAALYTLGVSIGGFRNKHKATAGIKRVIHWSLHHMHVRTLLLFDACELLSPAQAHNVTDAIVRSSKEDYYMQWLGPLYSPTRSDVIHSVQACIKDTASNDTKLLLELRKPDSAGDAFCTADDEPAASASTPELLVCLPPPGCSLASPAGFPAHMLSACEIAKPVRAERIGSRFLHQAERAYLAAMQRHGK